MASILIVEDDRSILDSLSAFLMSQGYETICAVGETEAVYKLQNEKPRLVLIDICLAEGNGYEVCREAKNTGVPAIFLTASDDENSVVGGLDMGADDYVAKPFRPRELLSRIKNVLRRYEGESKTLSIGSLTVDPDKATVTKNGADLSLSALEYRLLLLFVNNRGKLLLRERLLEDIWDAGGDFVNDNTLTVYIKRLRDKIEDDPQEPSVIKTVRGLGYRMD